MPSLAPFDVRKKEAYGIAFYITSRLFLYYHALVNNRAVFKSQEVKTVSIRINLHNSIHKMFQSFDGNRWLWVAASTVPEEKLYAADSWGLILTEIQNQLKPFLDAEVEVPLLPPPRLVLKL